MKHGQKVKYRTCHYHQCRKRTKVFRCEFCDNYFCKEHRKPVVPSTPNFQTSSKEGLLKLEKWRESGHPDPNYVEYTKLKEKERFEKSWKALNKLKEISYIPTSSDHESKEFDYSEGVPIPRDRTRKHHHKEFNLTPLITAVVIIGIAGLFLYLIYNPNLFKNITNPESDIFNETQEIKSVTKEVPYILNFEQKKAYLPSEYEGKVNDTLLGLLIKMELNPSDGWQIDYKDYPQHSTTKQRIIVGITKVTTGNIVRVNYQPSQEKPSIIQSKPNPSESSSESVVNIESTSISPDPHQKGVPIENTPYQEYITNQKIKEAIGKYNVECNQQTGVQFNCPYIGR